jgi:hypothetical protein
VHCAVSSWERRAIRGDLADDGSGGEGGYLVVFDEDRVQYGLATSGVFLNYDRSLVETIMGT